MQLMGSMERMVRAEMERARASVRSYNVESLRTPTHFMCLRFSRWMKCLCNINETAMGKGRMRRDKTTRDVPWTDHFQEGGKVVFAYSAETHRLVVRQAVGRCRSGD
jgi:hypothetical protein